METTAEESSKPTTSPTLAINYPTDNPNNIPQWDGRGSTLHKFEEDIQIYVASSKTYMIRTRGPRILSYFPEGSTHRDLGITLLNAGDLTQDDGAIKLVKSIKTSIGPQLEQGVAKDLGWYNNRRGRCQISSAPMYDSTLVLIAFTGVRRFMHDRFSVTALYLDVACGSSVWEKRTR